MKFFCIPLFACKHGIAESLDYSQLRLEEVPKEIIKSRKYVEELLLQINVIEELPPEFFRCTKLRKLDISENKIKVLPAQISALQMLSDLNLSKNEFVELPEEIGQCRTLSSLNISTNIVPNLPKSIINLSALTHLNVSDNPLTQLPPDIDQLVALQYLDASQCELRFLPPTIVGLTNLKMLDLCENYLIELPKGMDGLVRLEILDMHNNAITHIPEDILQCQALKCLDMTNNHLTELPEDLGDLCNLTELYICENQIPALPNSIGRLKKLEILKAAKNNISELTQAICSCEMLNDLILSENQLHDLPSSLGNLKRLQFLDLNVNNLSSLPLTIGGCTSLTILNLRHNQLQQLPMEIGRLSNLRVLDLIDNNLVYLPFTVTVLYQARLSALLLSFTQPSLPKLTVTNEPVMNMKVLTSYLLPQKGENINSIPTSKPHSCIGGARVCFANDGSSTTNDEEDKVPLGRFERYDTPHPKPFAPKNIFNRNSVELSSGVLPSASEGNTKEEKQEEKSVKAFTPRDVEMRPLRSVLKRPRSSVLDSAGNKEQSEMANGDDDSVSRVKSTASIGREIVAVTITKTNRTSPGFLIESRNDSSIRISALEPHSAAAHHGKLLVGDRLLTVNGVDVTSLTSEKVMSLLLSDRNADVYLVVERRPLSPRTARDPAPFPPPLTHAHSLPSLMQPSATSPTSPPPIPPRTLYRNNANGQTSRNISNMPNRSMGCLFDPRLLENLRTPTSMAPSRPTNASAFTIVKHSDEPRADDRIDENFTDNGKICDKLNNMIEFEKPLATSSPIPHESRTLMSHIPVPLSGNVKSTSSIGLRPSTSNDTVKAPVSKIIPPPVAPKPKINPERLNFSSKLQRFEEEINAQQMKKSVSALLNTQPKEELLKASGFSYSGSRRSGIPMKKPLVTTEDLEKLRMDKIIHRQEDAEDAEVADSVSELTNDACFNQIIATGRISGPAVVRTRNAEIRAEKARALAENRQESFSFASEEPSISSSTQQPPDEANLSRASSSMSSLEQRAADLEKRQAWRQARLKSMDVESQRTDDVLKLITSIPPSPIPTI